MARQQGLLTEPRDRNRIRQSGPLAPGPNQIHELAMELDTATDWNFSGTRH
jgi:hypothetical protein